MYVNQKLSRVVKSKDKVNNFPLPHPPIFQAELCISIPNFSTLQPAPSGARQMGNWGCCQSITAPFFYSCLLTLFPFSTVDPSHGLQSFRINLLLYRLSRKMQLLQEIFMCFSEVLSMDCRGICALMPKAPLPPLFSLTLVFLLLFLVLLLKYSVQQYHHRG